MANEPVRTVLIGTGGASRSHMQAIRSAGDRVEFVAAMDVDADRVEAFCEANDVPAWYADVDEMLRSERPQLAHRLEHPDRDPDLVAGQRQRQPGDPAPGDQHLHPPTVGGTPFVSRFPRTGSRKSRRKRSGQTVRRWALRCS